MKIIADKYETTPTNKDGIQYQLLLKKGAEEFWWPIFCSGTLKAIWNPKDEDQLFYALYSLLREKIIAYFRKDKDRQLSSLDPQEFTSYNSPHALPKIYHNLPESLEIPQDVTIAVKPLTCSVTVFQSKVEVSSIRFDIVDARDYINSLIEEKHHFKLFEIQQERAIVDMYLPCDDKETFRSRILALSGLLSWVNKKGIQGTIKEKLKKKGSIDYLEVFLAKHYPKFDKSIVVVLRNLNRISCGYPRHKDDKEVLKAYKDLSISWPIQDYKLTWEKILSIYAKALNDILDVIK